MYRKIVKVKGSWVLQELSPSETEDIKERVRHYNRNVWQECLKDANNNMEVAKALFDKLGISVTSVLLNHSANIMG